jgi:hypothetical protein
MLARMHQDALVAEAASTRLAREARDAEGHRSSLGASVPRVARAAALALGLLLAAGSFAAVVQAPSHEASSHRAAATDGADLPGAPGLVASKRFPGG